MLCCSGCRVLGIFFSNYQDQVAHLDFAEVWRSTWGQERDSEKGRHMKHDSS